MNMLERINRLAVTLDHANDVGALKRYVRDLTAIAFDLVKHVGAETERAKPTGRRTGTRQYRVVGWHTWLITQPVAQTMKPANLIELARALAKIKRPP